jgi:hypothetical protein
MHPFEYEDPDAKGRFQWFWRSRAWRFVRSQFREKKRFVSVLASPSEEMGTDEPLGAIALREWCSKYGLRVALYLIGVVFVAYALSILYGYALAESSYVPVAFENDREVLNVFAPSSRGDFAVNPFSPLMKNWLLRAAKNGSWHISEDEWQRGYFQREIYQAGVRNVTFAGLRKLLVDTATENNYKCIGAIHYGIPVSAMATYDEERQGWAFLVDPKEVWAMGSQQVKFPDGAVDGVPTSGRYQGMSSPGKLDVREFGPQSVPCAWKMCRFFEI